MGQLYSNSLYTSPSKPQPLDECFYSRNFHLLLLSIENLTKTANTSQCCNSKWKYLVRGILSLYEQ